MFLCREVTKAFPRDPDDCIVFFMPMYHAASLNGVLESVARGFRYVLINKFSFDGMLRAVQDYKV